MGGISLETLETARLIAKRPDQTAFEPLVRMNRNPRVMATLGGVGDAADTRAQLDRFLDHWSRRGYGLWMLHDRGSGAFAGRGGLRHVLLEGRDEVEVAYALMPEFWGRGLATEFARACVAVAFRDLRLEELVCYTWTENLASQRVMQKAGFVYERHFVRAELPHVLYRLKAPAADAR